MFGRARLYILLPFLLALSACAASGTVPIQSAAESAGVGVSVKVINSTILPVTYNADAVYFSRYCAPSEPCDSNVYISSYAKDGRIYWLDAPPGEYVAVAAAFRLFADPNTYITYFPDAIVRKTRMRVEKGVFVYLGDYKFEMFLGVCPDKADASQLHYAELFAPGVEKCGFFKIIGAKISSTPVIFIGNHAYAAGGGDFHYRGEIRQAGQDDALMLEFVARARKDLQARGWDEQLNRAKKAQ